jgi:hypothetical protein
MAEDILKVHHITSDPNTGETKLVRTTPYLVLKGGPANRPLILRQGRVYDLSGVLQEPVPDWVWAEAKLTDARTLREVGFDPEDVLKKADPEYINTGNKGPAKHWLGKDKKPLVPQEQPGG